MRALPLADAATFRRPARRGALARLSLAAIVAALGGLAFLAAREEPPAGAGPPPPARPLVAVVDVSASIAGAADERIASTLARIARARGNAGLVLFADAAAEALPPASRAGELAPFVPFFRPPPGRDEYYEREPWAAALGSGTRISTGLRAARRALERDAGGAGDVVLVSDLDTSRVDVAPLERELAAYARAPALDVLVVPLPGTQPNDAAYFRARLGPADVDLAPSVAAEPPPASPGEADFPGRLALLVVAIGLALAVRELVAVPLAWRAQETSPA